MSDLESTLSQLGETIDSIYRSPEEVLIALALYASNTAPLAILHGVYESREEEYLREKLDVLLHRKLLWFSQELDREHRRRLVANALLAYGAEARARVAAEAAS